MFTFDANVLSKQQLIVAVAETGFKATEVSEPSPIPSEDGPAAISVSNTVMQPLGRAMALNVPLVIQFTASWCTPCQRFKKETLANDEVKALFDSEQAIYLEIDTDDHPDIAKQFGIKSVPETVIMTPQGKSTERLANFQDAEALLGAINAVIDDVPRDVHHAPRPLTDLVDGEKNLKQQFNDDAGMVRMILILSPS